jgi:hypothetical protein
MSGNNITETRVFLSEYLPARLGNARRSRRLPRGVVFKSHLIVFGSLTSGSFGRQSDEQKA